MKRKIIDFFGTILLFIGFFLAFLPHAVHVSVGFDKEISHLKHVIIGLLFVVIALGILIINNKALKAQKIYNKKTKP